MHEAPEATRDPFLSHMCVVQADHPDQLHAMLGGLSSIKIAALLKGQGKPLHAFMTMNDMYRGWRLDIQVRDEERYEAERNGSRYEVAILGVRAYLVCYKVQEGMLPYLF